MIRNFTFPVIILLLFSGCRTKTADSDHLSGEGRNMVCEKGMVVSAHPESSGIGTEILKKGGNAVDAAVATEFALAVCYPEAGNIGGGGFMIYRDPHGRIDMIDYREKSPSSASRNMYLNQKGEVIPGLSTDTHLASGVPGTVDGMLTIHSKYGLLPFKDIIQPAIDLARKGFPVTENQASDLNDAREQFISRNKTLPAFVKNIPWKEGDTLLQPDLARTLERIRDLGREGFYSGITAGLIASEMKMGNGLISEKDLSDYRSVFRIPVSAEYRGFKITTVSPPSGGGIILLQVLGMLESFDLSKLGFHSWQSVHLIAEAEKRAFADRAEFLGDPDFTEIPVARLLNAGYLKKRIHDFNENMITPSSEIGYGNPYEDAHEETTHYSVVDSMGGSVAATTTLNGTFGTCIVVDGAGFLLNNQMDDFSTKPGVPNMFGLVGGEANAISPGKKMLSSMTPVIVENDGKLFMVAGSPGGSTIPTTVLQVIINVIDFGMDIGQAVDAGRFHHQWQPDNLSYETGSIDSATLKKLEEIGYKLKERSSLGRVNAILITGSGLKRAGADRRGKNSASGY
jgi:gamma-glutamyltranspeptidase/glutathione hydrolase